MPTIVVIVPRLANKAVANKAVANIFEQVDTSNSSLWPAVHKCKLIRLFSDSHSNTRTLNLVWPCAEMISILKKGDLKRVCVFRGCVGNIDLVAWQHVHSVTHSSVINLNSDRMFA